MGVQILNKSCERLCLLPQTVQRYSVEVEFGDASFSKTAAMYIYDPKVDDDVIYSDKSKDKSAVSLFFLVFCNSLCLFSWNELSIAITHVKQEKARFSHALENLILK